MTTSQENNPNKNSSSNKRALYAIVITIAIASIAFRLLDEWNLEQTALLFVGLPTVITLSLIKHVPPPKSASGIIFMVITLFLLISAIVFGEGIICVIMAAPIFYSIGAILILFIELIKYFNKKNNKQYSLTLIPLLLLLSQAYNFNAPPKIHNIQTSSIINGQATLSQLNQQPNFLADYPSFFKMGFPKPIAIIGTGIELGDTRNIQFLSQTKGVGTLQLRVIENTGQTLTFEVVSDDTHIAHWLTWKQAQLNIEPINEQQSKVHWNMQFTCDLGPSWYFLPLEKYAVKLMNQHLINAYFEGKNISQ